MAENSKNSKKDLLPDYLKDNDFVSELNFKLWVTKGARFKASERCNRQSEKYTQVIAFVSAYLIILSVLGFCKIPYCLKDNYNIFITIALSIIVLVSSQFLYASNYSVKSIEYHKCALEISELYNKLRIIKSDDNLITEVQTITNRYEHILCQYSNHLPIDYDMFKTNKSKYFELRKKECIWIKTRYFLKCDFLYYLCLIGLPLGYMLLCI